MKEGRKEWMIEWMNEGFNHEPSEHTHTHTQNEIKTSDRWRHTVEMCAFAGKVHLISLWPWPLTSDFENL